MEQAHSGICESGEVSSYKSVFNFLIIHNKHVCAFYSYILDTILAVLSDTATKFASELGRKIAPEIDTWS